MSEEVFKGKKFEDIFEEIYSNCKSTRTQVYSLIGELKPMVEDLRDATVVVPLIKDYLDIGVKNDDHMIKLANVLQKREAISKRSTSDSASDFDISDIQNLLDEQSDLNSDLDNLKDG